MVSYKFHRLRSYLDNGSRKVTAFKLEERLRIRGAEALMCGRRYGELLGRITKAINDERALSRAAFEAGGWRFDENRLKGLLMARVHLRRLARAAEQERAA